VPKSCGAILGALLAALSVGCGASLPAPDTVRQPVTAFQDVPYPPPAAFVELVPEEREEEAVWLDGSWSWQGTRYVWRRGGWVKPRAGALHAPWQVDFRADGTIWFAPSAWFDARGRELPEAEVIEPAATPPNELSPEELRAAP
jgi:hypothetical protein